MNSLPRLSHQDVYEVFAKPFLAKLKADIELQQSLLRKTEKVYKTYHEKLKRLDSETEIPKFINETDWLKLTLYQILEDEFPEKREIYFEEEFKHFYESAMLFLEKQPQEVLQEQSIERYKPLNTDSAWVAFVKPFKQAAFLISRLPQKISNAFRKDKKTIKRWSQKVPLRRIMRHYFLNQFIEKQLPLFREMQQLKSDALNLKWSIDRDINVEVGLFIEKEENKADELLAHIDTIAERNRIQEHIENLDRKFKQWETIINKHLAELLQQFEFAVERVDTFELSRAEFNESKIQSGQKVYQNQHLRLFNGWRNTLFAQLDDFQLDIEFFHIKYSSLLQFYLLKNSLKMRIHKTIKGQMSKITEAFDQIVVKIEQEADGADAVEKHLLIEKNRLKRELESKIIPQTVEEIYNQNLPYLLDRLENKIKEQLNKMKPKRIIYAQNEYNAPISKSDLSHFNPKELVLIDAYKHFIDQNKRLKSEVISKLESLQGILKELSGIVDYNLDSAINSVEEQTENSKSIALEGLERSRQKVVSVEKGFLEVENLIENQLKESLSTFNAALIELTDNENITNLRLKLAKAKAVERTEAYQRNIINNILSAAPTALRFLRAKLFQLNENLAQYLKLFGIKEEKEELSAELSDFLSQSELALEKLPYVYRRLYRIEPLREEMFFEGRVQELKQIKAAYQNWQDGQFSNCCIVGEKGSGASSLINFFLEDKAEKKLVRHKFKEAYHSKQDFFSFFSKLLRLSEVKDIDDLIIKIQESPIEIIILEDAQHFFLKKIKGFEALNLLFEIMSQTSKKVFWCLEFTTYTWRYLKNTINIQRYFKHTINLSLLEEKQIVELILKRHRVSGYDLRFDPNRLSRAEERKLRRLKTNEQQAYLQEQFFKRLNAFAKNNISLALLYWIRSTQKVEENTIVIGELENMQFDFLKNLDNQYLFTLHNLLIHDSLNIEEHAQLFHQNIESSRMTLMVLEDNGVLKNDQGRYYINRLLYRQTVNVLTKKNILH